MRCLVLHATYSRNNIIELSIIEYYKNNLLTKVSVPINNYNKINIVLGCINIYIYYNTEIQVVVNNSNLRRLINYSNVIINDKITSSTIDRCFQNTSLMNNNRDLLNTFLIFDIRYIKLLVV